MITHVPKVRCFATAAVALEGETDVSAVVDMGADA
jgi:hypothetical protein